ncbi:MAG: class I SAM-dependent methyltransferase [Bacillota bacterium]
MLCKLCGSSDLDLLGTKDKYYYCNNCQLIFIEPEAVVEPEVEKSRYEGHDNNHQNEGYVQMFEDFIKQVIEPQLDLKQIDSVLEFGCGPGPVLADLLAAKDLDVQLYDPYFYPEEDFKEKKYDLITSTEVFEHFVDPVKEIKLLKSLLKEGGYLAIMTSFHPGPAEFSDWWYTWDQTHITFYNHKTFKKIAAKYGLEIVYTDQQKYILLKS